MKLAPERQKADCSPRPLPGKPLPLGWRGVLRGEVTAAGDGGGQGVWGIGSGENIFSLANYFP